MSLQNCYRVLCYCALHKIANESNTYRLKHFPRLRPSPDAEQSNAAVAIRYALPNGLH